MFNIQKIIYIYQIKYNIKRYLNIKILEFILDDVTNIKQHIKIDKLPHRKPCGGQLYVYYNNGSFQINRKSRKSNEYAHHYLIGSVQKA